MDVAEAIAKKADNAAEFLSGLANTHRLLILCELANGERNVSALINATGIAQTSMSQHLGKLKKEGIVDFRREHRTLHYFIADEAALQIMTILYERFCRNQSTNE
ncbi:helix-turn-helix transcriptional regulator [Rhizobium sp. P40RR-XXII]|uniref:ArsR/SmtB family transcription factor n=1 Tax=Rhizobium sp. P40RR-XXII TaxID=2726739 RepID=UPI0014569023|nr:metalloregulator ArsR/SmtB family transcription factor [Rhizobium sp. P40RR-XXII]NLS20385.1 helix-turn-helix transcriptional regulator [Rhizobium sp. P40RR-XXII]